MDAGLRVVEVKAITGTGDTCGELDEHFRYMKRRDRHERNRWYKIGQAFQNYTFLPPIDLYLYGGEYYAVDGNRRVAAVIQIGIAYIDATVTEYVSRDNYIEMAGALHRVLYDYFDRERWRDIDLVISCGDIDARYLSLLVTIIPKPLIYVPGNHDEAYMKNPPEGCDSIDDRDTSVDGTRVINAFEYYRFEVEF
jgi:3',5'-cyclic AMP phosphodiesterase CpdA